MMKKALFRLILLLAASTPAFAASGIFGTAVVLGVNGTKTLYATTLLNDSRHTPINVTTPTLVLGGLPGNLGTFNLALGNSLTLMGGEVLTFKNGSDNVTGATIRYRINGGAFSSFGLVFNQNNVNGANGDQRWYGEGANVNILSGLNNGTHTLEVFYEAPFTFTGGSGTHVVNNGTFNYATTFTLVPEPSCAVLGSIGLLALLRRRR